MKVRPSIEIQATMEKMWKRDPSQFDPNRDCFQKERIERTLQAIEAHLSLKGKRVVDMGCGSGVLARLLRDRGATVDALDISSLALKKLKEEDIHNINPIQDCLPTTKLKDDTYDLVICTEVVGYLNTLECRLLMSELSRVMKPDGYLCFSTALDVYTDDPIDHLSLLAETEFEIEAWYLSYNSLWDRLAPFFRNSRSVMHFLEKVSRFFWVKSGISHALFIGKRRPLIHPLPKDEIPKVHKQKRHVWE